MNFPSDSKTDLQIIYKIRMICYETGINDTVKIGMIKQVLKQ